MHYRALLRANSHVSRWQTDVDRHYSQRDPRSTGRRPVFRRMQRHRCCCPGPRSQKDTSSWTTYLWFIFLSCTLGISFCTFLSLFFFLPDTILSLSTWNRRSFPRLFRLWMNLTVSKAIKSHTTTVQLEPYSIFPRNQKNHWNCQYTNGPVLSIKVGRSDDGWIGPSRWSCTDSFAIDPTWGPSDISLSLSLPVWGVSLSTATSIRNGWFCSKESTEGPDVVAMSSPGGRLLISIVLRKGN